MKLGVITNCFRLPVRPAIERAAALGFDGVQIYATGGEFCPAALDTGARKEYKKLFCDLGLEVSALCGDMGGHGFEIREQTPARIEATNRIVDLAHELETSVVTTHIGVIPSDKNEEKYEVMLSALTACGRYAKEKGVTLAIETGPEDAKTLLAFLKDTDGGVGVNLDPANFVMVTDQDPVEAVEMLGQYIKHTHVKDGVMLKKTDPKIIYGHFATGGIEALNIADYFKEVPVGEGDVDFPAYLEALKKVGFDGYLTIEREAGANPEMDIIKARDAIRSFLK